MATISGRNLIARVVDLRNELTSIQYGLLPSLCEKTLEDVVNVLRGKLMIDADGNLHTPCAHDGATQICSQCCKCGNVIKVRKLP